MKKQKENNNLYVENPTVGYQESQQQQQPNYDRKVETYNKKEESYYNDDDQILDEKADTKLKQARMYGNPFLVAGVLYAFWPLGLYWMWKYKVYNKIARIILSIVITIYGILRFIGHFTK